MSNIISNILTINGTEDQVAKVRDYIKGPNGESISLQSIVPQPKNLKGRRMVEVAGLIHLNGEPLTIPDWLDWRFNHWGCERDAESIRDDAVDAPNRILFNTSSTTSFEAMIILSLLFPEVTLNVIYSDACPELYCGEYTIKNGKVTNYILYDAIGHHGEDIPVDQQMEYYSRTHEYAREEWKKTADGEWINIYDEEDDYDE